MAATGWAAFFRWQSLVKVVCLIALIVVGHFISGYLTEALQLEIRPRTEDLVHRMIMVSAIAYAILIAIPFVPGVEVGLAIIGLLGPRIVFLVYVATLVGLSISFGVGRLVPLKRLIQLLDDLHFRRAADLLRSIEPMAFDERLAFLTSNVPTRLGALVIGHRYLALALVLNLPGNFLIGGGGGICLIAGLSRLYSVPGFIATIVIAVSPLPIAIYLFGKEFLSA